MIGFAKKLALGATLAATALTAAVPADAQRWGGGRWHRDRGSGVATGALVGGIVGLGLGAAIASSNRDRYYDRGYYYDPPRRYYRDRYYAPPRGYYRDRYYAPRGYYRDYYEPRGGYEYDYYGW